MDTTQLIIDSAQKIFSDYCTKELLDSAEQGNFAQALHTLVVENGFDQLGTASSGTTAAEMYAFIQECGRYAVPLPIAESLLVNNWSPGTGLSSIGEWVDDQIINVAWGRQCQRVVGVARNNREIIVVDQPKVIDRSVNLAGEPRDTISIQDAQSQQSIAMDADDVYAQMALTRINLIAGGLQTVLDLGLQFASERVQFGRAISKFQAIQHSLAVVAAEVAAAKRAADAPVDALGDDRFVFEVAASKARVGEAVGLVAEQVHQIHGAMGFTHEHRLHHYTRRVWAWRDEWGNEFHWQALLGAHLAQLGADRAWDFIATRG